MVNTNLYVRGELDQIQKCFITAACIMLGLIICMFFALHVSQKADMKIAELQKELDMAKQQLAYYELAHKFAEEYGIDMMKNNPGKALAVARASKHYYEKAITEIALDYNPKLTKKQANSISEIIYEESLDKGFNPLEIAAVIATESDFVINAVSCCKARGLMQIMEGTGKELAKNLGIKWTGSEMLFNPRINIKFGVTYLAWQRKINPSLYLIGYYGGEGAVRKVVAGRGWDDLFRYKNKIERDFIKFEIKYSMKMHEWDPQMVLVSTNAPLSIGG